ncbi:hypothetical protein OAX78_03220 [Planctomycetota bacterium]|nr:hypothetical protein [Planctomycetota bacterium]
MTKKRYDSNGEGRWSRRQLLARYNDYARRFGLRGPLPLDDRRHETRKAVWIYPTLFAVVDGVGAGDPACVEIAVELIEADELMPFGRILKSNAARALRLAQLTSDHVARIRTRVFAMLKRGEIPREFRDYAKLLRRVGVGPGWSELPALHVQGPYARRWRDYLLAHAGPDPIRPPRGRRFAAPSAS